MRTDEQLIRLCLGDPDFMGFQRDTDRDEGSFHYYRLSLRGPRYRGFPDEWQLAVHAQRQGRTTARQREQVLDDARAGVARWLPAASNVQPYPLVLVSDDPEVRLGDSLRYQERKVFFVDATRLPPGQPERQTLRFTPLVAAVRNKLNNDELSKLLFAPYAAPGHPARGWRFFGRRSELDRLVNTDANYFVLGVRRIGKTSLLKEAARRLRKQGRPVIFVPCQFRQKPPEVIESLLRAVDASAMYQVVRRGKQTTQHLGDSILSNVLRQLVREHPGTVLIFDEIGNAINNNPKDDWLFAGTLRDYSQTYDLRVIMSGWQEFTLKWGDFEGPFVNFGSTIRLRGFSDGEIEEFIIDALGAWGHVSDKRALRHLVTARVGRHPFLLLYFGSALFNRLLDDRNGGADVLDLAGVLLTDELVPTFAEAVKEVFYTNMSSRVLRYLFLRRCVEVEETGKAIAEAEITERWVGQVLAELGYPRNMDQQRGMLADLEMRGLIEPSEMLATRFRIVAPVVYACVDQLYGARDEMETLREEIAESPEPWPYVGREVASAPAS